LESALDETIARASEVLAALPNARKHANLSLTVGQDAFDGASSVLQALICARRSTADLHGSLHQLQGQLGLGAYAMGDMWKMGDAASTGLTLVEPIAA
jgi:hypothetical protein